MSALEPLELAGHDPAGQRHRVLVTFPSLAAANVALAPEQVMSYAGGGVIARRVPGGRAADRSVIVTSAPRYSGPDGASVMSADVARVLAALDQRGARVNGGRPRVEYRCNGCNGATRYGVPGERCVCGSLVPA